jgi:hypothetical protein
VGIGKLSITSFLAHLRMGMPPQKGLDKYVRGWNTNRAAFPNPEAVIE